LDFTSIVFPGTAFAIVLHCERIIKAGGIGRSEDCLEAMEKIEMRQQVLLNHLDPRGGPRPSANIVVSFLVRFLCCVPQFVRQFEWDWRPQCNERFLFV